MNIYELYNHLEIDDFSERIKGELKLIGNYIIWSFTLTETADETESHAYDYDEDDEDNYVSAFSYVSSEESLQDTCDADMEIIKQYINELDEFNDWTYSDPDVDDDTISFKIF